MNRVNKILLLILMFLSCIFNISQNVYAEVYGSVSGKVINVDTGEAVGGIGIRISVLDPKLCKPLSCGYGNYKTTDENGNYVFEKVPPGEYKIEVDFTTYNHYYYYDTSMGRFSSGYSISDTKKYTLFAGQKSIDDLIENRFLSHNIPINLEAGKNITNLDIFIKKIFGSFSGKVLQTDNTPFSGHIRVELMDSSRVATDTNYFNLICGIKANKDGFFKISQPLKDSASWILYVEYRPTRNNLYLYKFPIPIDTRGAKDIKDIIIHPEFDTSTIFSATIYDTLNIPLINISMTLIHTNKLQYTASSDENGIVNFKGILDGEYRIELVKSFGEDFREYLKRQGKTLANVTIAPEDLEKINMGVKITTSYKIYEYSETIKIINNNILKKVLNFDEGKARLVEMQTLKKCMRTMNTGSDAAYCEFTACENKDYSKCVSNAKCTSSYNPTLKKNCTAIDIKSCGGPISFCGGKTYCMWWDGEVFSDKPTIELSYDCDDVTAKEKEIVHDIHEQTHYDQLYPCSKFTTEEKYNQLMCDNGCEMDQKAYKAESEAWDKELDSACRGKFGLSSDFCDEQFAVNDPIIPTPMYYSQVPDVAILDNGASLQMQSLISNFKYGSILTDINTTPQDLLNNFSKILIAPTGSLVGNDSSPQFKAFLDQYVSQGGFLVVMSTQHSSDLQCIPIPEGEALSGFLWREDMSCVANSIEIQDWHNILSGQSQATISESVDGFFTLYPHSSRILLRRKKNGQPCMLIYPYGKGWVLATTIYTDYGYSVGQASQSGKNLIRDIVTFAKNPVNMQEYKPGDSVNIPITITNKTDKESASASVSILTPDGEVKEVRSQNSEGRIEPGESIVTNYTGIAGNELGIWRIEFSLFDSSGIEIQKESFAGNFVVSNPPAVTQPSPNLSFSVQSDAENYALGSNLVVFVVMLYLL